MRVKSGQYIRVVHQRKGTFYGIATEDFDSEVAHFFPIIIAQPEGLSGVNKGWEQGEAVACRREFCQIEMLS